MDRNVLAIYDPDRRTMEQLLAIVKRALPNYDIACFTSVDDLINYTHETVVEIIFLDIESLMPLINLQKIVGTLKAAISNIDFVLLCKKHELDMYTALWAIRLHALSMRAPYSYEDLTESLEYTWYHIVSVDDSSSNNQISHLKS